MFKPTTIIGIARVAALAMLAAFGLAHGLGTLSPPATGTMAYALTLSALLSAPRLRRGDVAAAVVALLTVGTFAAAIPGGVADIASWMAAVAGVGAAVLPIELAGWRMRSARNPHRAPAERRRARARRQDAEAAASPLYPAPLYPAPLYPAPRYPAQRRSATPTLLIAH